VVVPRGTPPVKINAIRNYGGKVVECDPDSQSRVLTCNKIASEENKLIIPPYDDYDIMCGQGTVAVEFLQQLPQLDCIFVAVSGGGLISGISSYAKAIKPSIKIFACEPVGKNLEASLRKGERLWPNENKFLETKADAIRTVQCGQLTFPLILKLVEKEVFTQDDDSMTQACLLMFERLKIVGELAAGASLAAVLSEKFKKDEYKDLKNVGVIVCGGNIDIKSLQLSS
jgi:serine racemase